jgi:hypothetical protein
MAGTFGDDAADVVYSDLISGTMIRNARQR